MLKIAFDPIFEHPLPEGHRFPMLKYRLLPEQLLHEGTVTSSNFFVPSLSVDALFETAHDPVYIGKLNRLELSTTEWRKIGFPPSVQLIEREKVIASGTWECVGYALEHGIAMNSAGGTHHAFRASGEGFCILNDIAVAATQLLHVYPERKIAVLDLDVHQGNGTAAIFKAEKRVFTFSMHGEMNYPAQKEPSDWDIPLSNGTGDGHYLNVLKKALTVIQEEIQPDFVFYQAGVDVLDSDRLGKLSLTLDGCRQRDKMVLNMCKQSRIPVVVSMGGGYSERIATIVDAHANTFRLAQELFF